MELLQLQYFIAVAQGETLMDAAERFYTSQSSLSRSITQLEEELGIPLFERSNKKLRLTTRGEWFLKRVQPLVRSLELAKEEALGRATIAGIQVRAEIMPPHLMEAVNEYRALHPEQQVHIQMPWEQGNMYLDAVDLAITGAPVPITYDHSVTLCQEELLLLANRLNYQHGTEVELTSIQKAHLIFPTDTAHSSAACKALCRYAGFEPQIFGKTDELSEISQRISDGYCFAFVSSYRLGQVPEGLVCLRISWPEPIRDIALCWNNTKSPQVEEFRNFLMDFYRRPPMQNVLQESLKQLNLL